MRETFQLINEYPFTTFLIAIFLLVVIDMIADIFKRK